jgi:hypothetical protein
MKNGRKEGGKKKEEKRTQKDCESYTAHPSAALSISHRKRYGTAAGFEWA